jgi:prevent-host-death family protein
MKTYSIAKFKNGLSSIVAEVANGGEVLITDHNRPVARLVPVSSIPALPKVDVKSILKGLPIKYKRKPKVSIARLIRQMRDEE